MRNTLFAFALLTCLAGCAKEAATDAPASPAPSGATGAAAQPAYEMHAAGPITMAVPKGWEVATIDADAVKKLLAQPDLNPEWKEMAPMLEAAVKSGVVKIMAFDFPGTSHGFTPSLNVVSRTPPKGVSHADLEKAALEELAAGLPGSNPKLEKFDSGHSIPVSVVTFTMPSPVNDGHGHKLAMRQYLTLRSGKSYVITFTTQAENAAQLAPIADEAVRRTKIE